ncbi:MAG: HAD-IC family P-type ATPase, partial [Ruminococcus sp.]|nr:HAD-IC family P-type ATPase [Ruminococcus sp.]
GTITSGEPKVTDIITVDGIDEKYLLSLAYSLERKSEHPLAKAVLLKAEQENISADEVTEFQAVSGNGLKAVRNSLLISGGNYNFISTVAEIPDSMKECSEKLAEDGKTPLFFAEDNRLVGIIAVADVIKEDSPKAVKELQNMGIHVVMLTGDNERTAKAIGRQAGVDEVIAGVLPDGKESVIRNLKKKGKTIMVGDGINDAPALTSADIGIAIGAGTDVAIDAADVVLMKSRLSDVPASIRLSRATLKNIHENLFWAFIYNIIGIPLAAGVYIKLFGWQLNPMFGAAAMSLSSFCVVTNALRLNLIKIHDSHKDRKINKSDFDNSSISSDESNTVTIKIKGMMCGHCEAHVKEALENIDGVTVTEISYGQGRAVVELSSNVDNKSMKKAIEEAGYKVTKFE